MNIHRKFNFHFVTEYILHCQTQCRSDICLRSNILSYSFEFDTSVTTLNQNN